MIKILPIDKLNFNNIKFDILLGEKRTYNEYFNVIINSPSLKIGLQTITGGIMPKAELLNDNTLLINGLKEFYGLKTDGTIIKAISSEMVFYDFQIINNNVLLIGEIEIIMLDKNLEITWEHKFSDITVSTDIIESYIFVKDIENKMYKINLDSGVIKSIT